MSRNNRELSQFASFIEVTDNVKKLGITTDLSISGGLGIGAGLSEYLQKRQEASDPEGSLIAFSHARFLGDVVFDGNVNIGATADAPVAITSDRITVPDLYVTNLLDVNAPAGIAITGNITIGSTGTTNKLDVANPADFFGLVTFNEGTVFGPGAADTVSIYAQEQVIIANKQFQGDFTISTCTEIGPCTPILSVEGGARISEFLSVEKALKVSDYITIGSSANLESEFISTCKFSDDIFLEGDGIYIGSETKFVNDLIPGPSVSIGSSDDLWSEIYTERLFVTTSTDVAGNIVFTAAGATSVIQFSGYKVDFIDGINASKDSSINNLIVGADQTNFGFSYFIGISTFENIIEGIARTSLQANAVDIYDANLDSLYYPTYSLQSIGNTSVGDRLYVSNAIGVNPISSDAYIGGDLSVLGDAINADVGALDLRFYVLNSPKAVEAFLSADELTIGGQASIGVATIRNGETHVNILQVNENIVQASTGNTNFLMEDDINTKFFGNIELEGNTIKVNRDTAFILDETVQYANLLGDAIHVDIGSANIGITSLRNNRIDLYGDLLLKSDQILASDEAVAIQLDSNIKVTIQGDLLINGNDILASTGATNITLQNDQKTIFAGDIQVGTNEILASDGNMNIMMESNTLTSIAGALRIEGNEIQAGTGATNITLLDGQQTIFAGDIRVNGNSIRAGNGLVNIEMEDNTKTIFQGDIQVNGDDIRGADGTICITLEAPSGNVAIGSDLYANSVYFSGNDAILNNHNIKLKDSLIDISLLEDETNLGTLIGPNTVTNYDAGLVLNYFSVGLDTSKRAAIFWDNSVERIAIATDTREQNPNILTVDGYAELESKGLVINSASGVRRLLEDDGTYLQLKRVVIDAGTY